MHYLFHAIFGIAPSIVWLLFYLRKDAHPESHWMVIRIFFFGMIISLPVLLVEIAFFKTISKIPIPSAIALILNIFIGISLTEELFKYLVVKYGVLSHSELDEPIDVMLYMIIAALGFAASENILLFLNAHPLIKLPEVLSLLTIRFVGATFLHALCSGIIGFFLAFSFFEIKSQRRFFTLGMGIAVLLHGLYDFSIITMGENIRLVIPIIILTSLAIFVSLGFKTLQRIESVCKVK